ncbi:SusC/RagA family TonB-linked outer membrane protein [Chitinophaga lutea]
MKLLVSTFLSLVLSICAVAQTRKVTGTVRSSAGPIPGVTVQLKGSRTGVTTSPQGHYSIDVPASGNAVLTFRFIGYRTEEVNVNGRSSINVDMTEEASSLNDVVVVGYNTVRRGDLTGSVSSVSARQIKDIPINSASQALAGRLAGVQVTGSEGSPNADVTIRVRGGGSITQDNAPLYIIDGVQVENGLNNISPQDIETIDVLKDASTTAIYGARGANGVVIITTKGGRNMKTTLGYNGFVGFNKLANKLDVMNPYDFVTYWYERSRGSSQDSATFANRYGTTWDTLANYKNVPMADWQDQMFGRTALTQTHNVSLSGGNVNTSFNLSLTSNREDGIMLGSDFDRKLAAFKFDHSVNKVVKVGFNARYNHTVVNGAGTSNTGSSATNRLRHSIKYRPLLMEGQSIESYDPDYALETNANSLSLLNPILLNEAEYRKNPSDNLNLNGYVNLSLTRFLSFRTTLGYDLTNQQFRMFDDTITNNAKSNSAGQPLASIISQKRVSINNSNVLTFSNASLEGGFHKKNVINVLLGQETYQNKFNSQTVETRYFPIGIKAEEALGNMGLGTPPPGGQQPRPITTESTFTLASFFGKLSYTYANRYLFTGSLRADGSSKFAEGNEWGYFPSASFAWRASQEPFLKDKLGPVEDLKLRVSYGEAGNNRIADFLYLMQYGTTTQYGLNDGSVPAFAPTGLANKDLVWETTVSRNAGIDIALWNSRLNFSADVYRNTTKNLLVAVPIAVENGYSTQIQNVGATYNKGVEFQVNAVPVRNRNFSWNVAYNMSFNKNMIESLGDYQDFYLQNSGWAGGNIPPDFIVRTGSPVGTVWGYVTDGFYTLDDFNYNETTKVYTLKPGVANNQGVTSLAPQPGLLKFKNLKGDSAVTAADDRTVIGTTTPKFFGGLNQQFTYKHFDLSVFLNFQVGNDVYNANKLEFTSGYTTNSNMLAIMNDRWRTVNDQGKVVTDPKELAELNRNAKIWQPSSSANSFVVHSWAIEDGSFLRINNVTLGYSLPDHLLKHVGLRTARFYATVNNLAVLTGYSGYDPEVNARRGTPVTPGIDYSAYPRSRTFLLGVNVSL